MDTIRHILHKENINFNLYTVSRTIIPSALRTVIDWGCQKKPTETFEQFIERTGRECSKNLKKEAKQGDKLKKLDAEDFDATFLYKLIPAVCDDILPAGTEKWNEKVCQNEKCVENLLRRVKNIRDDIAHHDDAKLHNIDLVKDVERPIGELLEAAGNLYSIPQIKINVKKTKLKGKFKELNESGIDFIRNNFAREGKEELKAYWTANRTNVNLPPETNIELKRSNIFFNGRISHMVEKDGSQNSKKIFPCNMLFQEIDSNFIVLQGDPGFGKSTILKMVVDSWVGISSSRTSFPQIDKFDMVVFLECFQKKSESFVQILKSVYPKSLAAINLPEYVLQDSMSHLKILFVIDGYDECSKQSREMVHHLIETSKTHTNRTFLVSSRPLGGHDLISYLTKSNVSHKVAIIESINTIGNQIEFLERYQSEMYSDKSTGLVQAFKSMPEVVRRILTTPLLLAMFCCMYFRDKKFVTEWKSEWHIFSSFHSFTKSMMISRANSIDNSKILIDSLVVELSQLCLKQLLQSNLHGLNERAYDKFCKKCSENISKEIPYDSVLSCVLMKRTSINKLEKSWSFLHLSFQEYLAASFIVSEIEKQESDNQGEAKSIEEILKQSPGFRGPESLHRLLNVFRYVTLELNYNSQLRASTLKDLSQVFKKIGAPFSFCADLVISCQNNRDLCKALASAAAEDIFFRGIPNPVNGEIQLAPSQAWLINGQPSLNIATEMLKHSQPHSIDVELNEKCTDEMRKELKRFLIIAKKLEVTLGIQMLSSLYSFDSIDDIALQVKNSKCKVETFEGCLNSAKAVEALRQRHVKRLIISTSQLTVEMIRSLHKCKLIAFGLYLACNKQLENIKISPPKDWNCPVVIKLLGIENKTVNWVEKVLSIFAPQNKRLIGLILLRSRLSKEDAEKLLAKTRSQGYITAWPPPEKPGLSQLTHFRVPEDGICPHCKAQHGEGENCYTFILA